ncbi:MAG: nucleoside-diphosphate kinase [Candidatus Sigynarchaeota archaeon]
MSHDTKIERTLVLVKPDGVLRRQIGVNVLKAIKKLPGSSIIAFAQAPVTLDLAKRHFSEHEGQPYFQGLMAIMTVPVGVLVLVVEGNGIVGAMRDLIGPRFVEDAKRVKGCLRGKYGIAKGVNAVHASGSINAARREVELWIKELDLTLDKDAATKAVDAYIAKWDGRLPDNTKSIQKEMGDVLEAIEDLKAVLKTETTEDDETTRELIRAILIHTL